ncbi:MAG: hypothetical protein GYA35_06600 [Thermoanaerobaculaceae bacterium]|nr:hypothetical protein [Thermoanaerobaculaceae bacterium]
MNIKERIERSKQLILAISKIGRDKTTIPSLKDLFPFKHYFDNKGNLKRDELNEIDGLWTRREILTRYLLVSAVLDQGPDLEGVRRLLKDVVNSLYEKEIRIFHKPIDFFKELGISIDEILEKHASIKNIRADYWAKENESNPNKYNLFTDRTNQVLGYAVYRWGVPLCVPHLLEKDLKRNCKESTEPLVEYIESWDSSETMSQQIKDNERYGLGKAIGDKAGHLFAKFYIHTYRIGKRKDEAFGPLSYELPFDSNAGRVLFRTGFLLDCAKLSDYEKWEVVQKGKGKGGKHYIRVTNIRGKKSDELSSLKEVMDSYEPICIKYLKVRIRRPSKIEIQQIPNTLLLDTKYGIGDLDDGLINIGTKYCFNHNNPNCKECPIKEFCLAYKKQKGLIKNYRT